MLMPKRVKRRKQFRGSMRGKATRGNKISYGEYGIARLSFLIQERLHLIIVFSKNILLELAAEITTDTTLQTVFC